MQWMNTRGRWVTAFAVLWAVFLGLSGGPGGQSAWAELMPVWTWMKGSPLFNRPGTHGTLGTPAEDNTPGAREKAVSWTDPSGALWLFGGSGYDGTRDRILLNDLWKYDPASGNWTWMKGTDSGLQPGTYSTLGTPNAINTPGVREGAVSWTDPSGALWLFGGYGWDVRGGAGWLNDLWKYDPASGNWTWIKGASVRNQRAVYGTPGIPAAANTPGARQDSVSWTDPSGALWLFGGLGYDGDQTGSLLNDLWKFDPVSGNWAWMKGSWGFYKPGTYGTLGTPETANTPGARQNSVSWTDPSGALWLFGGYGCDGTGDLSCLNDLWKYDPVSGNWTWMKGSWLRSQSGTYGILRTPEAANTPSPRFGPVSWTDPSGAFWLFGGYGYDGTRNYGNLSDLWKFDPVSGNWAWMSGPQTWNQSGTYDPTGTPEAGNTPGGRNGFVSWTDSSGGMWLFGGMFFSEPINFNLRNDLWRLSMLDRTLPVITLLGDASVTVECGDTYTDAGAEALDGVGRDLGEDIIVEGLPPAIPPAPGVWTVTYNVIDAAGYPAVEVSREVTVVDTTPPFITLAGSPEATVECGGIYTDAGATALDACDGDRTADIVTVNPVNTTLPGAYTVTYNVADGHGNNAVQVSREVTVTDTTPPVITLAGSPEVTVECGGIHTDAGATALDACDGDQTADIATVNPVNTALPGAYTVTYNVADGHGNNAVQVSREVTVTDTTPPVITLAGLPEITVECGAIYTDAGATALDACDGDRTADIVTVNPVNTALPGAYAITYNVADGHGNNAVQITREVIVGDTTAPVITLAGSPEITIECGAVYTDAGATALDACGGDLSSQIVVTGNVNSSAPGTYTLVYSLPDAAGNTAVPLTRTVQVTAGEACRPAPTVEEALEALAASFDEADTENDSRLSFSEAQAVLPGLTKEVFDLIDTDGDGYLSRAELGLEDGDGGCGCAKSLLTPEGLKKRLGDLFLAGLVLSLLAIWGRRRN